MRGIFSCRCPEWKVFHWSQTTKWGNDKATETMGLCHALYCWSKFLQLSVSFCSSSPRMLCYNYWSKLILVVGLCVCRAMARCGLLCRAIWHPGTPCCLSSVGSTGLHYLLFESDWWDGDEVRTLPSYLSQLSNLAEDSSWCQLYPIPYSA